MSFSIHDIKSVNELYDEKQVNKFLRNGWVLLSVGFNTDDDNITSKVYILGNVEMIDPYSVDPNSRLAKLRNE